MAATTTKLTDEQKAALTTMRKRLGEVPKELREHHKKLVATRKAILEVLATGPATVPAIAEKTGLDRHSIFWRLTGMKKFGEVREDGDEDDYLLYALVDPDA